MDQNGDMLRRIIALLFSLARLAEMAAGLPRPVRHVMLGILRWGEIAGRKVVAREATYHQVAPWMFAPEAAHCGDDPHDAIKLAMSFRFLALALVNMVMLAKRVPHQPPDAADEAAQGMDAARRAFLRAHRPAIIDTS